MTIMSNTREKSLPQPIPHPYIRTLSHPYPQTRITRPLSSPSSQQLCHEKAQSTIVIPSNLTDYIQYLCKTLYQEPYFRGSNFAPCKLQLLAATAGNCFLRPAVDIYMTNTIKKHCFGGKNHDTSAFRHSQVATRASLNTS